jgi:hypothetical protein
VLAAAVRNAKPPGIVSLAKANSRAPMPEPLCSGATKS